jgi:hypothetical protein
MMKKLKENFEEFLKNSDIQQKFMTGKLILFCKDGTERPKIEDTRPICILPTNIHDLLRDAKQL